MQPAHTIANFGVAANICLTAATFAGAQSICQPFRGSGNALEFNGESSQVELINSTSLQLTNATFEAWVMPASLSTEATRIISNAAHGHLGFGFGQVGGGRLRFTRFGLADYDLTTADLAIGQWTHVAVVYQLSGAATFYVNGQPAATINHPAGPLSATSLNLRIGKNPAVAALLPPEHWDGLIDEVRVWTVARTAEQILENYDKVIEAQPGLYAYLRFSEGRGATTIDSVGGHHGAISGATWISTIDCPMACPSDLNGDGVTNGLDLAVLLGSWGSCP